MALQTILSYPCAILQKKSALVSNFDEQLKILADDMAETMYAAPGVGLAAPQIGVLRRVVVIDVTAKEEENNLIVLVNPQITQAEGQQVDEEGCLSVVDYATSVKRFQKVWVEAYDLSGKSFNFEVENFYARVIQHELDHLDGKLFIDRISTLKRSLYKRKRNKQLKDTLKK